VRIADGANAVLGSVRGDQWFDQLPESGANDNGPDEPPPTDPASVGLDEPVGDDGDEDAGGRGDEIALEATTAPTSIRCGVEPSILSPKDAPLTQAAVAIPEPTAATIVSPEITAAQPDAPPADVQAAPVASDVPTGNDVSKPKTATALPHLPRVAKASFDVGLGLCLIDEGKRPFEKEWQKPERVIRTLDEVKARLDNEWVSLKCRNFGIRGGANDLVIIDVDNKSGANGEPSGMENWTRLLGELAAAGHVVPDIPTVLTPSGGLHLYLRQPSDGTRIGCSTGSLPRGIDVRGDGGQVLAPGSVTAKGKYEMVPETPNVFEAFKNGTIPHIPQFLIDIIGTKRSGNAKGGEKDWIDKRFVSNDLLK
jgi:Bifunctional DNA primase/polymerase, N-terminal